MLTTVANYCAERNVTRQFVYKYIREGKFKAVELPTFTRHNGKEITVGVQKFLEIPDAFAEKAINRQLLKAEPDTYDENLDFFVSYMTDSPILEAHYRAMLECKDPSVQKALKEKMYADIDSRPDEERAVLLQQLDVLNVRLMAYMKKLRTEVREIIDDNRALNKK
jgi:hypothetical protein